jgi:hypothetical protein
MTFCSVSTIKRFGSVLCVPAYLDGLDAEAHRVKLSDIGLLPDFLNTQSQATKSTKNTPNDHEGAWLV